MKPYCFVLMPLGDKKDANGTTVSFDSVYQPIFRPVVEAAELTLLETDPAVMIGIRRKLDRAETMRVILKDGVMAVVPETPEEQAGFASWSDTLHGHVFVLRNASAKGGSLHDLGLQEDACREPINVVFDLVAPQWQPISNLSQTPFMMDGRHYASIEGFWQGLKFPDKADRARIAALSGKEAKNAARQAPDAPSFVYGHDTLAFGGPGHHALMQRACEAKFTQHLIAREALLSTGDRPLVHRVPRDSKTIPGALMADIWMRLRDTLREAA